MMTSREHVPEVPTEQAIRAWTRRSSGAWSDAQEADLQKWLAAAPEHRAAYDKVTRVWGSLGGIEGRVSRLPAPPPAQRARLRWAAAAVIVVLALPLGFICYTWWNGKTTTWSARRGETRTIVLTDGTRIVLDADSEIEARIGARARHVILRRGEALLSVARDTSRPFAVEVGRGRVTDLGTRFDVENLQGRAQISVLEGRVGIETPRGRLLLDTGSAGGYAADGTLLPVHAADRSVALWSEGQRHFNADRLADVLERLRRYHPVSFVLTDPQLRELRVSGTFRTADLPLFLRTLQAALPIETRWTDSQHVEISPRAGIRPRR